MSENQLQEQEQFDEEVESSQADSDETSGEMNWSDLYASTFKEIQEGQIVTGTIVSLNKKEAMVDVGYKSEGAVELSEFLDPEEVKIGDEVDVLVESKENESGMIVLSKKKADKLQGWQKVITSCEEGDNVEARIIKKVKGGLIVDIGVEAFLPASLCSLKGYAELNQLADAKTTMVKIIKINKPRKNIVVSRKNFLLEEREKSRQEILQNLEAGQIRQGLVKNITDFGVFIDLGGVDGLLHITDMSWSRISHPSEMVALGDEIQIKIIEFDKENMRVSLGLKQISENPWKDISQKYPIGTKIKGRVVNIVPYGAFIELEKGVEGLVHISELSWTKRISNPSEVLAVGDIVEAVVLSIDEDNQKISLGIKQIEVNPWLEMQNKYPVNTKIEGKVRNITDYGLFVEIENGIDGLVHVSDISWTRKASSPTELFKKGEIVEAVVLSVDVDNQKIALGMKQLTPDPWEANSDNFQIGAIVTGKVSKIANFGMFIELADGIDGLLHSSEIPERLSGDLQEKFAIGQDLEVKIIKVDEESRKIALTLKGMPIEDLIVEEVPAEAAVTEEPAAADGEDALDTSEASVESVEEVSEASEDVVEAESTEEVPAEESEEEPKAE